MSKPQFQNNQSFTLVELLIVIGILAILTAAVVIVLNPAELLQESRDSKRLQDITALDQTIQLGQSLSPSLDLGTASTVYISIPDDASSSCATLGLPLLPSGWNYHCVSEDNLHNTNGTGWIPINFTDSDLAGVITLSSLPIDPTNTTSTGLYYTYIPGGSYKLTARTESSKYITTAQTDGGYDESQLEKGTDLALAAFNNNWVWVPGSSTYATTPGFFVMKYEAKYDRDGDGIGDDAAGCSADLGVGYDWRDCGTGGTVLSSADGAPIVHITHDQAKTACASIGATLITNDQWMTIARNIDQQDENWTGGSVGSGCLFRGNSGETTCGYDSTLDPDYGTSRNSRAYHTLSTGDTIYDLSGNVYDHVMLDASDTTVPQNQQPTLSTTADDGAGVGGWGEYTALSGYGSLSANQLLPSDASWDSDQGVGRIWTYGDDESSTAARVLIRGGYWSVGVGAGPLALLLSWSAGNQSSYGGFRCAR